MQIESVDLNAEKTIGNIIAKANNLTPQQVQDIVERQQQAGLKFGEAAVDLGYVKKEDVLWALAQQYDYPYAAEGAATINSELVVATDPFDSSSEFFRDIRSHLISNVFSHTSERYALAVCSPQSGDGKSFFAANLAVSFSQLGGRTLLLDADMRTPRQQEIFRIESYAGGLSGVLAGRAQTNVVRPIDELPSLYVLPTGVIPPNPLELVQRPAFDLLIAELLSKFDYVVVDTPAVTHGADARVIAAKCGAAIALGRKNVTPAKAMRTLVAQLEKGTSKFAGAIFNEFS